MKVNHLSSKRICRENRYMDTYKIEARSLGTVFVDLLAYTTIDPQNREGSLIEIGCTPATPPSGTGCTYFVNNFPIRLS
jgi:hypothetical protein